MPIGDSESVDKLDRKHNFWANNIDYWSLFDLLYKGGKDIQANAAKILKKRPKELAEVYSARLAQFDYQNILGPALGWYLSALFRKDPTIDLKIVGDDTGKPLPDAQAKPYTDFLDNCDRAATTFVDLWRDLYVKLLIFKGAYAVVDLPKSQGERSLGEQLKTGAFNPYLVIYDPRAVINWDVDDAGELLWAVIKIQTYHQEFLGKGTVIDRWTYYDRQQFRVYERSQSSDPSDATPVILDPTGQLISSNAQNTAKLVDEGPHSMASADSTTGTPGRVPIRYFTIPDGLWLANRAYLPAIAHCNLENSYDWALFMANLPIPVIKSDTELTHTISETAVIHLDEKGTFEWTEPKGTSFEHSEKALAGKREEIYRALWLMAQGRSSSASASASSGYSKELDMQPSRDVLAAFGDIVRAGMQKLLADVAVVREDAQTEFDVRGFNFEVGAALQESETLEIMMSLDIPSDTLYQQAQHRVADAYLTDANRTIIEQVHKEIDAAPTRSQQQAQEAQAQKLAMDRSLNRATLGLTAQAQDSN